jgi:hypothetical protein
MKEHIARRFRESLNKGAFGLRLQQAHNGGVPLFSRPFDKSNH